MGIFWQVVYLCLYFFLLLVWARFGAEMVLAYARRWHPGRRASVILELVFSPTDPPLKVLRRVIPPLRLGTVSLDLAGMALLLIVFVLMQYVVRPLMVATAG
ncbi:YggT family protein [Actinorhabdospora filicis]|uniref:YggT family protein n=1 Tax=Actinorhabdospora filicis TaxID=1785913 RepID=A0A9W6W873_9ACTN|nr:YggT family protein [Actinorhabdospora filicis]GLZ75365.1 YggT family protein [Actinorhabdospora filicis]